MRSALAIVILGLTTSAASAGRLTVGGAIGRTDGHGSGAAARLETVFGRLRISDRLSLELEAGRALPDSKTYDSKRAGAAAIVDLSARGRWTPYLVAALAVSENENQWWRGELSHREAGIGVDYALGGDLAIGFEARVGERHIMHSESKADVLLYYWPVTPSDGDYATARVTFTIAM